MKPAILILMLALAFDAGAQVRRDPFARPASALVPSPAASAAAEEAAAPGAPPAPPRLRAIMFEPGKSLVNINGRILAAGERYDDYRIDAIGPRSATLTRRGVRSVIVLDEESSK
jgi:hypothetical protein